jgi:Outer membrane protein beta-barrel domain
MKKVITLFTMSLMVATSLYSQVKCIPKVGASWSSVSTESYNQSGFYIDYGYRTGLIIGIAAEFQFGGDMVSLKPEFLFHQKGYTLKYGDGHMKGTYTYTLNYFEIPILASVNFGRFYVVAGPYLGNGIIGTYRGSYTYLGQTTDHDGEIEFGEQPDNYGGTTLYVNPFDFGFQMGAGVKVSVIVIDLRFGLGCTDIFVDEYNLARNRSFQLTLGLPIIGKK